jgi:hypothetical protein
MAFLIKWIITSVVFKTNTDRTNKFYLGIVNWEYGYFLYIT